MKGRTVCAYWYPTIRTDSSTSYHNNLPRPAQGICNLLQLLSRARANLDGRHGFVMSIWRCSFLSKYLAENKESLKCLYISLSFPQRNFLALTEIWVYHFTRPRHVPNTWSDSKVQQLMGQEVKAEFASSLLVPMRAFSLRTRRYPCPWFCPYLSFLALLEHSKHFNSFFWIVVSTGNASRPACLGEALIGPAALVWRKFKCLAFSSGL